MKRLICALIVILMLPWSAEAACTGASPRWASTADYASLNACASGATAGDTIVVTGNATWNTTDILTLTRGLHLIGSGNPTLTKAYVSTAHPFIYWDVAEAASVAHDTMTIRGFIFESSASTFGGAGIVRIYNYWVPAYVTAIILNNTFSNTYNNGRGLYVAGTVYGVASGNTFDRVAVPFSMYSRAALAWDGETRAYGSSQNFYMENSTIQWSSNVSGGNLGWVSSGDGGRVVVRYNTWDFANLTSGDPSGVWDIHGLQSMQDATGDPNCGYPIGEPNDCDPNRKSCEQFSTMVVEYYGNAMTNAAWSARAMAGQRGGWAMIFNNTYAASSGTSSLSFAEYACDTCASSGSHVQRVDNSYNWNNFSGSTRLTMTKAFDMCADAPGAPYTITANTDFWTDAYATFNGTAGVGCGTLAARPATCTTGVGYWATTQSCTDLSGQAGASPSAPISGTLYKCTSTDTWEAYFTPYTYPHPLAVTPAAPTSARIK